MKRELITDKAPSAPGFLSQAIAEDGLTLVFTSGQVHLTPEGKLLEGTVAEKTHQVMRNLKVILEAGGVTLDHVVKATLYVIDMSHAKEINETYVSYFARPFPAREMICVKELPMGATLEISMIATKDKTLD